MDAKKSGQGTSALQKSTWLHFEQMNFLRGSMTADESQSNLDVPNDDDEEEIILDSNSDELSGGAESVANESSPCVNTPKRKRGHGHSEAREKLFEAALKGMSAPTETEDEAAIFGKSVAASLRKLDMYTQELAKLEIQRVIFKMFAPSVPPSQSQFTGNSLGTFNYSAQQHPGQHFDHDFHPQRD